MAEKKPRAKTKRKERGIYRYSDGQFGVEWYQDGRCFTRKIGTHADAVAFKQEIDRRKRVGGVLPDNKPPATMADVLDLYLARAENRDSRAAAIQWKEWIGHARPEEVTEQTIRDWVRGNRKKWQPFGELTRDLPSEGNLVHLDLVVGLRRGHQLRVGGEVLTVRQVRKVRNPECRNRWVDQVVVQVRQGGHHRAGAGVEHQVGLAESSLHRWIAPLSAAFRLGVKAGLCNVNPLANRGDAGLKRPSTRKHRTMSPQEELRILEVWGEAWWPYVQGAVMTGLRWASQFGMQWSNVNLDARQIKVMVKGGPEGQKEHTVFVTDQLLDVLLEMRRRFPSSPWVFPSTTGKRMSYSYFGKLWRKMLEVAGIENLHWHDLRGSLASKLIALGYSMHVVKEILGHEDSRTTERHYAARSEQLLREAAAAAARTLPRK